MQAHAPAYLNDQAQFSALTSASRHSCRTGESLGILVSLLLHQYASQH